MLFASPDLLVLTQSRGNKRFDWLEPSSKNTVDEPKTTIHTLLFFNAVRVSYNWLNFVIEYYRVLGKLSLLLICG